MRFYKAKENTGCNKMDASRRLHLPFFNNENIVQKDK